MNSPPQVLVLYVGRKRYGLGYLSVLSVLLIDDTGRRMTPAVVLAYGFTDARENVMSFANKLVNVLAI